MSVVAITGYTGLQLVMVENQHLLCYRLRLLSLYIQLPPHIADLPIHGEVYKSLLFLPLMTFNCSLQASSVSISVAWRSNVTYYKNDDIFRDTDFTGLSITVTWWRSHTKIDQNMLSYWTTAAWSANQAGNNRDPEKWAGCRSVGVLHGLSQTLRLICFLVTHACWGAAHSHSSVCLTKKSFCRKLVLIWRLECLCDNVRGFFLCVT